MTARHLPAKTTPCACTTETVMLPLDAASQLKNGSCEDDEPSQVSNRAAARWTKEGSTVVSTVKDTGAATSSLCEKRRARLQTNARAEPSAWPKYQTRKVWNDSQTPPRQTPACRLHDRDGHAPLGRCFAAEEWVMRGRWTLPSFEARCCAVLVVEPQFFLEIGLCVQVQKL